ncbi:acyl-CoA dehydrogenase [Actinoplanes lobatus]|uniref:Acyl-CoA dehydrogenase n=1 Tax=Actinoplanes lobatus TaxID=113568 RepID=A0A7W7MIQ8_9ACTN|nr:acyl-CoA dehydrogenase family protein [Actinoplanes lobatus]MBB4751668.1 alkylation response protein AidB-like acyl-CoA dehydrogenase [Actinoplanes lobatus]GGN65216.1 acyl-CoA dehydrogenase [Actinoplanes lobatus]GIE43251.1 acyl-CoA dehydrogenase [Actinoplanes lobatus]
MDFDDTPDEAAWRAEVRSFLDRHPSAPEQPRAWQAILYDAGFVGVTWPVEAGGRGGTPMQQAIVDQETARHGLPPLINLIGIGMCGPTVIVHGSDSQKQRYLKRLLRADDLWCQLFSEPSAGSDLAALRTRAVRDGDGWRISGQKVWTTLAHLADFGILLTRTDPDVPKHRGLTMFVVDMKAPGVTVRPLRQMNGDAHFNEVFFDDVRIPDEERLGDVGDGWRVALTTLMSERLSLGGGGTSIGPKPEAVARHVAAHIGALPEDRQVLARQELGRGYVAALGARYTGYRQLSKLSRGELPGPEASAGKLSGTRSARDLTDLAVRVLGPDAATADAAWQDMQALLPGMAIAGGSDQVLRNIIGERVLGLPAEPRADKGVTFRESIR